METLLRDIDDIDSTLEKLKTMMAFRYDNEWDEKGSMDNAVMDAVIDGLLQNVIEFVEAVDTRDYFEMSKKAADIMNLICMVFLVDDGGEVIE